jgi:hypothetical protein
MTTLLAVLSIIVGVPGAIVSMLILKERWKHTPHPPKDDQPDERAA